MEYSALLRGTGHESKLAGLGALKEQRLALMSRIAELRRPEGAEALPATRHAMWAPGRGTLTNWNAISTYAQG